ARDRKGILRAVCPGQTDPGRGHSAHLFPDESRRGTRLLSTVLETGRPGRVPGEGSILLLRRPGNRAARTNLDNLGGGYDRPNADSSGPTTVRLPPIGNRVADRAHGCPAFRAVGSYRAARHAGRLVQPDTRRSPWRAREQPIYWNRYILTSQVPAAASK